MRVSTAFDRLLQIPGATVTDVVIDGRDVEVTLRPRARLLRCLCGMLATAVYDRRGRRWRHLDLGQCRLWLVYEIRRLDCPDCGVRTEELPWARPGVGAIATQSFTDRRYGWRGLQLLERGETPIITNFGATGITKGAVNWDDLQFAKKFSMVQATLSGGRANDLLAVGVMHELAAYGLEIPKHVAVVGMDDSELAEQSFPPLTSVNLGSAERGRRAAELLLARIDDYTRTPRRIVVQPTLSVRRSTP